MKPFRDSVWLSPGGRPAHLQVGFVMPGMDNRSCAGAEERTASSTLHPRDEGPDPMADVGEFNMASRSNLDMRVHRLVGDYTEGTRSDRWENTATTELHDLLHYGTVQRDGGMPRASQPASCTGFSTCTQRKANTHLAGTRATKGQPGPTALISAPGRRRCIRKGTIREAAERISARWRKPPWNLERHP